MMRDIWIKATLPEAMAQKFDAGEATALVAVLEHDEVSELQSSVNGVDDFVKLAWKSLSTLLQKLETEGTKKPEIGKTLHMLMESARASVGLHDRTRQMLGRAVFIGKRAMGRPN